MVSASELKKLKVSELREELAKRELDTKGVKDDLIARLASAMGGDEAGTKESSVAEDAAGHPQVPTSGDAELLAGTEVIMEKDDLTGQPATATAEVSAPEQPGNADPASDTGAPTVAAGAPLLTEAEKIKLRKERFGNQSGGKQAALAPLGHVDTKEEMERRKKRAERFGLPIPVFKAEEEAKKKARAERFGLPATKEVQAKPATPADTAAEEAKKKARAQRFENAGNKKGTAAPTVALSEDEQKKRAERAKRFAPLST